LDKNSHEQVEKDFNNLAVSLGLKVITWRNVPTDKNAIGTVALKSEPLSRQVFITADLDEEALKRQVRN
jgi:glutamate synthase (NADPH/NADH)